MSDSLFSKIKKFISKVEDSSEIKKTDEDSANKNIEQVSEQLHEEQIINEIIPTTIQNSNNESLDESNFNNLSFDIDEEISDILKEYFYDNNQVIYGCLIEKQNLIIKGFYSKSQLPSDYVILLLDNLINIIVNNKILLNENNEIDSIEKLLIISEDNYQYVISDENKIIILITSQKNQLITWKLLETIKEKTFK